MSDTPPVSPSDPAGWLRARVAELEAGNARLRQAAAERDELAAAQLAARDAQIGALAARVEELQRLVGKDSSTSVFEAAPPPPPEVTEYQILAKQCPACGETSIGLAPAGVTGRVQYGRGSTPARRWRSARTTCPSPAPRSWSPR